MDLISALLGVSFASGLNVMPRCSRWVCCIGSACSTCRRRWTPSLSTPILVVAAIMFAVEFVVDIPYVFGRPLDTVNLVVRPAARAFLAFSMVGHVDPGVGQTCGAPS